MDRSHADFSFLVYRFFCHGLETCLSMNEVLYPLREVLGMTNKEKWSRQWSFKLINEVVVNCSECNGSEEVRKHFMEII